MGNFEIPTRQKADLLFSTAEPLGIGDFFISPVRRVSGYAEIPVFALADQPFTIQVEEATDVEEDGSGNFVQTQTLTAVAVGPLWLVCERIRPCGSYMQMTLGNLGGAGMTSLNFSVQGLPLP